MLAGAFDDSDDVLIGVFGAEIVDADAPRLLAPVEIAKRIDRLTRAPTFAEGATASSRSRNTWSAALAAALALIFSLEAGVASSTRLRRFGRW
jgi:hypothetical protein